MNYAGNGNLTHIVNTSNSVVAEFSYDVCLVRTWSFVSLGETKALAEQIPISAAVREGRKRDKDNWSYTLDNEPDLFAGRGFTGHKYLPYFMIYNMNGRLYDPVVGRFLSPDNNVQMPDFTQNFNRYSYALNNPLKYSDPDGEYIFTAFLGPVGAIMDAACWGAVLGGAGYTASIGFSDGGFNNWNWGHFGRSVGVGAISGAVTGGIGQIFGPVGSMGFGGEIVRAYTHSFTNGKRYVQFNGRNYALATHAHTHPSMADSNDNPLGLSQADLNMQRWIGKPIHILYNKGIYSVDGTYNYKTKVWNYKYIGTW